MDKGNFFITGIQQIGVGTTSVYDAWKWYIDIFGVDRLTDKKFNDTIKLNIESYACIILI